jgi:hypothetical protein
MDPAAHAFFVTLQTAESLNAIVDHSLAVVAL